MGSRYRRRPNPTVNRTLPLTATDNENKSDLSINAAVPFSRREKEIETSDHDY